jgi:OOP family OmpA-OmpF porin
VVGGFVGSHKKLLIGGAVAALLSGCSSNGYFWESDSQQSRESALAEQATDEVAYDDGVVVHPNHLQGTAFDRALYHGYMALAKKEDFEHDFEDRAKFLDRAQRAGRGILVSPEELSARDLPADTVPELREARRRLEEAFYAGASVSMPEEAAAAQVKFDCWMEQQEEDIQPHDIKECKLSFYEEVAVVESGKGSAIPIDGMDMGPTYTHSHEYEHTHGPNSTVNHTHSPEEIPDEPVVEKQVVVYKGPYIIFFDLDKDFIRRDAAEILDQVAADAERLQPERIVLTGHTDTSGTRSHNEPLSERRVANAERALRELGVSATIMRDYHFGEQRPRIATPDGVRKEGNRRVEIDFEW